MKSKLIQKGAVRLGSVEINVTENCNLCCKGCDHAMGIIPGGHISSDVILDDIRAASTIMHVRVLRIIGGEPLLHPDLTDILKKIRETAFTDLTELWTNGTLLKNMSQEAWNNIDGIVVSKYPQQKYHWNYSFLRRHANKFGVWVHIRECSHFKWSLRAYRTGSFSLVKMLHATCREAHTCHTIRNGRFYKCVQAAFAQDRLSVAGINILDDGVSIHNNPKAQENIRAHLESHTPLNACSYCLGEFGAYFPHEDQSGKSSAGNSLDEAEFDPQLILPDSFV